MVKKLIEFGEFDRKRLGQVVFGESQSEKVKTFNDLRLEANNPGEVVGSITMCYDLFSISDI